MLVLSNIAGAQSRGLVGPVAVTIGNFDGCHRGHQDLVAAVLEHARRRDLTATALTFDPRPEAFFHRTSDRDLLFTPQQKLRAFAELGLAATVVQGFDEEFSRTTAEAFVDSCLATELGARAVVVGDNFRFGQGRRGDTRLLRERASALAIDVHVCDPVTDTGGVVSSSRIRAMLAAGDVTAAATMLTRPYLLEGRVVRGDQLGRTLDAPTANLGAISQLIPGPGVYCVRAVLDDEPSALRCPTIALPAVCNVGLRPTLKLSTPELRVETHLLVGRYGVDALYGKPLALYFDAKLRDDAEFPDLAALKTAIATDIEAARRYYAIAGT